MSGSGQSPQSGGISNPLAGYTPKGQQTIPGGSMMPGIQQQQRYQPFTPKQRPIPYGGDVLQPRFQQPGETSIPYGGDAMQPQFPQQPSFMPIQNDPNSGMRIGSPMMDTRGFQQQQRFGQPKAWTPPPMPGQPQQPNYNDYNQAGGLIPKGNQPQPFRMPDGRMVDLRALNPEGLPMNIDANGIPRFTPTAMGQSGMDYAQSVGDGFTGVRGGNNWVNGRRFLGEPLHQGNGGMDPAMRSFLNTYRSRIGGTAANYWG